MTTQITVRLPDELVDFLDAAVRAQEAPSRAALVSSALQREMRRLAATRDVRLLAAQGADDPDLDPLVAWTGAHASIDLD